MSEPITVTFPFELPNQESETPETKATETKATETKSTRTYDVRVTSARLVKGKNIIYFNAFVNDIFCTGLSFIWGEKGGNPYEFISFPSQKYTTNDGKEEYSKYYSFAVSKELLENIKSQLQTIISKK